MNAHVSIAVPDASLEGLLPQLLGWTNGAKPPTAAAHVRDPYRLAG